jgi:hypothetical protein
MSEEGKDKVVTENPEAGVNAASAQLPFDYWDVANVIVEDRSKYDPLYVYWNVDTRELFSWPYEEHNSCCVLLIKWSFSDDEAWIETEDLMLTTYGYDRDKRYEEYLSEKEDWFSFTEYLQAVNEYNYRLKLYIASRMERQNLAAKWAAQINEASKNE